MRRWVERIKDVGNDANHELTPISAETALLMATFTEQLVVLAYEFNAPMETRSDADVPPASSGGELGAG
jgi:hypothetical protein